MVNTQKVALAFAGIAVALHVVWSVIVASGLGQWWVNFVLGLHFMQMQVTVLPFNILTAVELWVLVGIVGYLVGYIVATIWNKVHK